jgi:periplasmic protein TonB
VRRRVSRAFVMLVIVIAHGTIIYLFAAGKMATGTAAMPPIMVTLVDKPLRPATQLTIPVAALAAPKLSAIPTPDVVVATPLQASAPPVLSGQDPDSTAPTGASDGSGPMSGASAADLGNESSGIIISRRVQPSYSDESVRAKEQGYVSAAMLIDERGRVRKVEIVKSSGFRRLDQSVVNALYQWRFTRKADASRLAPARVTYQYGFHLAASSGMDLSTISLILVPYDPALAEQIRAAAVPMEGVQTPIGADALRRLIAAIQEIAPTLGHDAQGALPPAQLVARLGLLRSVQFLGIESRGLDFDDAARARRDAKESRWELYIVKQQLGVSEWLIGVTPRGTITDAQAMTCDAACGAAEP